MLRKDKGTASANARDCIRQGKELHQGKVRDRIRSDELRVSKAIC